MLFASTVEKAPTLEQIVWCKRVKPNYLGNLKSFFFKVIIKPVVGENSYFCQFTTENVFKAFI